MSVELWLGIGHYLLGVLVIFALVVALMETSRKFDRFHDNSYLLLATGYFLMVVWALIRAIAVGPSILQFAAIVCLLLGLLCLAFGYYFHHQAHPTDSEEDNTSAKESKKTPKVHLKEEWMRLLSADEEQPEPKEEPEAETLMKDVSTEEQEKPETEEKPPESTPEAEPAKQEKPAEGPKKAEKIIKAPADAVDEPEEIDLSYLASRSKKAKAPKQAPVKKAALEPKIESVKPEKIEKQNKPVKESREEIMDDLFPLAHQVKKKKVAKPTVVDTLPGEGLHDAK
jgi:cytoskeletal protein RodZ